MGENSEQSVQTSTPAAESSPTVLGKTTAEGTGQATAPMAGTIQSQEQQSTPGTQVPQTPPVNWEKQARDLEGKLSKYQSERDKAEARYRKVIQNVLPHLPIDEFGNVIGQPEAQHDGSEANVMNELVSRAARGDREAFAYMQQLNAEQIESNVMNKIEAQRAIQNRVASVEARITAEFPTIVNKDGSFNADDPIVTEARELLTKNPGMFSFETPEQMYAVLQVAKASMIQKKFPDIENKLRDEIITKMRQAGQAATVKPGSSLQDPHSIEVPREVQDTWKREGYNLDDKEAYDRLKNIYKQLTTQGRVQI